MLPAVQTTTVKTKKHLLLKDHIPETLFEEFNQAQKQLKKVKQMVSDHLLSDPILHNISPTQFEWTTSDGAYSVDIHYNMKIEGKFVEQKQGVKQIHIDPRTANLLISGKFLNDDEKRKLLAAMGLDEIMDESNKNRLGG